MNDIQIVLPMAGKGRRFKEEGIYDPKPLIDVAGLPMIKRATMSLSFFDLINPHNIICVVRQDDVKQHNIGARLEAIFSDEINIVEEDRPIGAATSVLAAKHLIRNDSRLIVMDCDIAFRSIEYESKILQNDKTIDGMIPIFLCEGSKWSFSRFEENRRIVEIAEKNRISDYANIGFYYFKKGSFFIDYAERVLYRKGAILGEYYISLVYKEMISAGMHIHAAVSESFDNMGTPQDLKLYLRKLVGNKERNPV